MRFAWHIETEDTAKVQAFVKLHCNDAFDDGLGNAIDFGRAAALTAVRAGS